MIICFCFNSVMHVALITRVAKGVVHFAMLLHPCKVSLLQGSCEAHQVALAFLPYPYSVLLFSVPDGFTHWSLMGTLATDEDTFMGFNDGLSQSGTFLRASVL